MDSPREEADALDHDVLHTAADQVLLQRLLFDAVALEPVSTTSFNATVAAASPAGFELAGVQLHVPAADVDQWVQMMVGGAPARRVLGDWLAVRV